MSDRRKDELVDDAEEAGIDADGLTKTELVDKLSDAAPAELGPVVRAGSDEPPTFEARGSITGVQPLTVDEIPDAGR